jgi:hypothetical protein
LDHVEWIPEWPLPPPDEIRFEAFSSVFTDLLPAIPALDMEVTLEVLEARSVLQLVQLPSALNDFTMILEFDDNGPVSSANYQARLTFSFESPPPPPVQPVPVPEPSGFLLFAVGVTGLIGFRTWRRRALTSRTRP